MLDAQDYQLAMETYNYAGALFQRGAKTEKDLIIEEAEINNTFNLHDKYKFKAV